MWLLCCTLQIFFKGRECEESVSREQENRAFDRRHFLENGLQSRNRGRKGYYSHYINDSVYFGLYTPYTNYSNHSCFSFAWILELQITCGRNSARISPNLSKPWAISFVQPCVLVGWNTSRPPMLQDLRPPLLPPQDRAHWSCLTTSDDMLLPLLPEGLVSARNTAQIAFLSFDRMCIIAKNNWNNRRTRQMIVLNLYR